MNTILIATAIVLLASLLLGMQRVLRGPTPADRMLAAQLLGSTGVAILLVLSEATATAGARDVALVFAILSVVNVVVFVRFSRASNGGA